MIAPAVTMVSPAEFPDVVEHVRALDRRVLEIEGHAALGDAVWRDFEQPGVDSLGVVVADVAYAHVARGDTFSEPHWAVGLALAPGARDSADATAIVPAVLHAAERHVAGHGGGRMLLWIFGVRPNDNTLVEAAGLSPARDLYEIRVVLPLAERTSWPPGIVVRDFVPGRDDAAWLGVNNRAFANHPEQGSWIEATLARRLREDWFDPTIFVLAFADGGDGALVGFNWCRMHPETAADPALGEIFVIGVDPHRAGRGLGRALAIEGLARMAARGIRRGRLFTDADNERALALYRSLGFTVHRTDRSYSRDVAPHPAPS